jgi:hypothetical protein
MPDEQSDDGDHHKEFDKGERDSRGEAKPRRREGAKANRLQGPGRRIGSSRIFI